MWLLPRSIRVRDTLIATLISGFAFGVLMIGANIAIRNATDEHYFRTVEKAAHRVAFKMQELPSAGKHLSPSPAGVDRIQVVRDDGSVIAATAAAGWIPLSRSLPSGNRIVSEFVQCEVGQRCYYIHVERVLLTRAQPWKSAHVYAARQVPLILAPGVLELFTATGALTATGLIALLVWKMVGWSLLPVQAIRSQLAEITASDLSRRVPVPSRYNEIADMARTANETLDRLERSVKRQRQFTADASHELRTPITALRANLEDALMHPEDTDLQEVLAAALKDTERLEAIITDLLLLARLGTVGAVAQEKIDLAELVAAEVNGRGEMIHLDLAPDVIVTGVPIQLTRLVANLLDNAQCYARSRIDVVVRRERNKAVLTVTDDGPGIPVGDRELVFRRFTRLDTARSRGVGGTGLGLPIARDIAQAHGGTLTVEDSPRGARLVLRIPLAY